MGNPTDNTFTWAMAGEKEQRSREESGSVAARFLPSTLPTNISCHRGLDQPDGGLILLKGSLAHKCVTVCCVCARMLPSSCVCTRESSWCDPTLRGRLIWLGVFGLCQSACLRHKCSHNWLLCSKCHSSQRKRKDPIAALFPIALVSTTPYPHPPPKKEKKIFLNLKNDDARFKKKKEKEYKS